MDELERKLHEHFGFEHFRAGQREVIEHVLGGRHTLAVMPTGLGKSLCYQLPAQMLSGLTLVISPLIALMQDQVGALERRGFRNVTALSSALSPAEIGQRFNEIERGEHKLVYIAPERCDSPRFQQLVRQTEISLVVIDEAHCISQWGHDFRPHYRTLLTRLPELRRATFLAVTATATPEVQNDIAASLALPSLERVIADFNRPNLRFESIKADAREEKDRQLIELLNREESTAIVYASTRKEAAMAYELLREHGIDVCLYHAGLSQQQRASAQQRFLQDECRVIVATVAFGLGIDKPNVRRVIHYNVPGSLENYYQEAGRGGRDGAAAVCTLFYSQSDVRIQRFLLDQAYPQPQAVLQLYGMLREAHPLAVASGDLATASQLPELTVNAALQLLLEQQRVQLAADGKYALNESAETELRLDVRAMNERRWRANERLKKMISYALDAKCRRAAILRYFGQEFAPPCAACDVCVSQKQTQTDIPLPATARPPATIDAVASEASDRAARAILQAALELKAKFGRSTVAGMLAGSRSERIVEFNLNHNPHYGALQLHTQKRVMLWIDELAWQELLQVTAEEYPRLLLTPKGKEALDGSSLLALSGFARAQPKAEPKIEENDAIELLAPISAGDRQLVERLKQWRREKASSLSLPPYIILHDSVIETIAAELPRRLEELGRIKGIGPAKLEQFGDQIIAIIEGIAPMSLPVPAAPKPASLLGPVAPKPMGWRVQVEMWRQGGDAPDAQLLMAVLGDWQTCAHGDLIVAINALKDLGARAAAGSLLALLRETSNGQLMGTICEALGHFGWMAAADDLTALLDDERPGVRRAAARALGRLRARAALAKIERLAQSDSSDSVKLAAEAAMLLIRENTNQ